MKWVTNWGFAVTSNIFGTASSCITFLYVHKTVHTETCDSDCCSDLPLVGQTDSPAPNSHHWLSQLCDSSHTVYTLQWNKPMNGWESTLTLKKILCCNRLHFSYTGFYGKSCMDACQLNPCENQAKCHRKPSSSHGYICDCEDNHYGQYCQHRYTFIHTTCMHNYMSTNAHTHHYGIITCTVS